jgi:uncharacterized Tic20 family protein
MQLRPDEKNFAMWCHLASLSALVGVPFGHLVGPLMVWQMKKNESAFVDEHGKESLNFQLSFLLYTFAAIIAMMLFFFALIGAGAASSAGISVTNSPRPPGVLWPFLFGGGLIGPLLLILMVPFLDLILTIIAAVKASNGEHYRYPFTIRFLR